MKKFNYFIFLSIMFISISLISSDREVNLPLPTLAERQSLQKLNGENIELVVRDFHTYCTEFHKQKQQAKKHRLYTGAWGAATILFGLASIECNNNENALPLCGSLYCAYKVFKNSTLRQCHEETAQELIKTCAQEFTSDEFEILHDKFHELNPRTQPNSKSLLFLAQREQWRIKNNPK